MKFALKNLLLIMSAMMICMLSVSCGVASKNYESGNITATEDHSYMADGEFGSESPSEYKKNKKIIENIELVLNTRSFDLLVERIEAKITECGGYVESSDIVGETEWNMTRYAEIKARIPSDLSGSFTAFLKENSDVVKSTVNTEDVTSSYMDYQSRLSALETEKAALEKLMQEASSVSDVLSIQDKLSNVIYEIEKIQSQLNHYDNLVDYTTVTMSISELEGKKQQENLSVWQTIGKNLKHNFGTVGNFFKNLFIFVVSAIPYLLVLAIFTVLVVLCVKYTAKQKKRKIERLMQKMSDHDKQ